MSETSRPRLCPLASRSEGAPRLAGSPTRCPLCHDRVDLEVEAWRVCGGCLARHHEECWEHSCAACRGTVALAQERAGSPLVTDDARWRPGPGILLAAALGRGLAAQLALAMGPLPALAALVTISISAALGLGLAAALEDGARSRGQGRLALLTLVTTVIGFQVLLSLYSAELIDAGPESWSWDVATAAFALSQAGYEVLQSWRLHRM